MVDQTFQPAAGAQVLRSTETSLSFPEKRFGRSKSDCNMGYYNRWSCLSLKIAGFDHRKDDFRVVFPASSSGAGLLNDSD